MSISRHSLCFRRESYLLKEERATGVAEKFEFLSAAHRIATYKT